MTKYSASFEITPTSPQAIVALGQVKKLLNKSFTTYIKVYGKTTTNGVTVLSYIEEIKDEEKAITLNYHTPENWLYFYQNRNKINEVLNHA